MELLIGISAVVLIAGVGVSSYNKLIRYQKSVEEARSGIDVQMKEKGNVVTNLLAIIQKQQAFETETLEKIVSARQGLDATDTEEKVKASESLTHLVNVVAEQYPSLGTNASYTKFMTQYGEVERKITYARTRYNATVTEYNTLQSTIPHAFFKGLANCREEKVYELDRGTFDAIDNLNIGEL